MQFLLRLAIDFLSAIISFNDVSLTLADRCILKDVSFSIENNEFVGLLGANGSGKTTLLRAILGIVAPQKGHVVVFDKAAHMGSAAIGYMPQSRKSMHALRLRGRDFVAGVVDGQKFGFPRFGKSVNLQVDRALDLVDARDLATRPLGELSGGERQRLLLAQTIVDRPQVLLLDEPLINLDPAQQNKMVQLIQRLRLELSIPVIFSSHEINPLLGVLDRVLYLGNQSAAIGTVDEVITSTVLSQLYNAPIDVLRVGGRIFVMADNIEIERDGHNHEHDHV